MKKTKSKPTRRHAQNQLHKADEHPKLPFIEHVYELRKRLFYIAISMALFGGLAAAFQSQLTRLLLAPAGKQQFIYTSPGGGFDFAFSLCLYTGIAFSIPVIVYQLLRYLQPLVKKGTLKFINRAGVWSGILAIIGMFFGYSIGLPAGLHFLLQGFSTEQIKALISIQSYLSFVMVYLLGSALLFQIPLVLLVINRIKPIQPRTLLSKQRWVILAAFVLGAIISPSPDIRNQAILSGPIIFMYEFSIFLIWMTNRRRQRPRKVIELMRKDAEVQAQRLSEFQKAQAVLQQAMQEAKTAVRPIVASASPVTVPQSATRRSGSRPRQYANGFNRPSYRHVEATNIAQTE